MECKAQRLGGAPRVDPLVSLGSRDIHKKASIVYIVEHEQPPILATAQPVMHQLKDVCLRILPPKDLDAFGYVAVALLEPRCTAGVHPEHPRLRRSVTRPVRILDGEL
jgi:hypothetical protein